MHLISGDLWAGAEAQTASLLFHLKNDDRYQLSAIIYNYGRLAEDLANCGIPTFILDEQTNGLPKLFLKTCKLLQHNKVDLLHTHRYKENILGAFAAKLNKIPFLVRTVHGLPEPFTGYKRFKANFHIIIDSLVAKSLFDKTIAVSEEMRTELCKKLPPEQIVTIHNAVDIEKCKTQFDKLSMKRNLGIDDHSPVIGSVGRLVPIKGYKYFLKAAKLILKERSEVRFLLVGDGILKKELQKMANDLQVLQNFSFLGIRNDVLDIMNTMDIFLLPSLHEGISTALLEALALGLPVVATKVGGTPEVLEHGVSGFLVKPKDEKALAEHCLELLRNPSLMEKMSLEARKIVSLKFSAEKQAESVSQLYQNLFQSG